VWEERLTAPGAARLRLSTVLKPHLPTRLVAALLAELDIEEKNCGDLKRTELRALIQNLVSYPIEYSGHQGYDPLRLTS
jgi:predicted flavoprotein YhiN